jgi:hypothetical protein
VNVNYVNHKGETVRLEEIAKKHKPKPKASTALKTLDTKDGATVSMGFEVAGFSPGRLRDAEHDHVEKLGGQQGRPLIKGEKQLGPWDEIAYMRENKPKRVAPKPYTLASSADQCAEMARAAGWKNVTVREILKG